MMLIEDEGQKVGKHVVKNYYWSSHGITVARYPLPCGDYILANDRVLDVISRKNERNIKLKKMDFVGTYSVAVDTKKDIQELIGDICGKDHARFRDQCILAQNNNIQLHILVQNDDECVNKKNNIYNHTIYDLRDLHKWVNKRLFIWKNGKRAYPNATKGVTLMKACITMELKYGVKFHFCSTKEAGAKVLEILGAK